MRSNVWRALNRTASRAALPAVREALRAECRGSDATGVAAELARRLVSPTPEDLRYRENRVLRGPRRLVVGYEALLP